MSPDLCFSVIIKILRLLCPSTLLILGSQHPSAMRCPEIPGMSLSHFRTPGMSARRLVQELLQDNAVRQALSGKLGPLDLGVNLAQTL